jgi:hypothetical protein
MTGMTAGEKISNGLNVILRIILGIKRSSKLSKSKQKNQNEIQNI